jgi:glycosyltransferase A (GT-A) superfamily protein (DUF2064 family)
MNQRAHPTVRPYALALGVLPHRGVVERLGFLGPAIAQDVASALLLDTLGALSTFPVRYRVVFTHGDDAVTRHTRLPATWREQPQRGATSTERVSSALEDLLALGAEAMLLVAADGPMLPLAQMFDGMMWLLPKKRVVIGGSEGGGLFAFGASERPAFLSTIERSLGLAGAGDEPGAADVDEHVADKSRAAGLEVQMLPRCYKVDGLESLQRLRKEVAGGVFAPHCRKLFERPELKA